MSKSTAKASPNASPNVPTPRARARKPANLRKERVAGMIAAGKKQGEIAKELGVSTRQVKRYRTDPKVREMVEERRQRMLATAHVQDAEIIGTLATQMRGSILDVLTPAGHFSPAHARRTGFDGLIKSVTIREEKGRNKRGKRTVRVLSTRVEVHNSQAAAVELAKICGLEKQPGKNPHDPEHLRLLLEERITFTADGFKKLGKDVIRREILEMFEKTPESLGDLYPLVLAELAASDSIN